jgi:hypothetical protein
MGFRRPARRGVRRPGSALAAVDRDGVRRDSLGFRSIWVLSGEDRFGQAPKGSVARPRSLPDRRRAAGQVRSNDHGTSGYTSAWCRHRVCSAVASATQPIRRQLCLADLVEERRVSSRLWGR